MTDLAGLRVVASLPSGAPGETLVCSMTRGTGSLPVLVRRVMHAAAPPGSDALQNILRRALWVQHPNVVQVCDVVQDGAGVAGVFAAAPGVTLAVLLREAAITATPIPGPLAVHIVGEICKGLHALHEATDSSGAVLEIIHSDLTPDSVWLTWDGEVRVMDVGLANPSVPARATEGNESRMWFISPELARGAPADRRSDVYSAAAILYRLVTGRPPFSGATPQETLRLIQEAPLTDARTLAPMLPPALGDMLSTGMARNPAERFQSASAFGSTLQRFLDLARLTASAADLAAFLTRLMPAGHPLRNAWTAPIMQASEVPLEATGRTRTLMMTPIASPSPAGPPPLAAVEEMPVVAPEEELSLSDLAAQERARQTPADIFAGDAGADLDRAFGATEVPAAPREVGFHIESHPANATEPFPFDGPTGNAAIPLPGAAPLVASGAIAFPDNERTIPNTFAVPLPGPPAPSAIPLPGGPSGAPDAIPLPTASGTAIPLPGGPASASGGHPAAIPLPAGPGIPTVPTIPLVSGMPSPPATQPMHGAPAPSLGHDLFDDVDAPPPPAALPLVDGTAPGSLPPSGPAVTQRSSTLPANAFSPAASLVPAGAELPPPPAGPPAGKGRLLAIVGGLAVVGIAAAAVVLVPGLLGEPSGEDPTPAVATPEPVKPVATPEPVKPANAASAGAPAASAVAEKPADPPPVVPDKPVADTPPPDVEPAPAKPPRVVKYPLGMGAVAVEAPEGALIFINGKKMPFKTPLDKPLFLKPGSYRFKVTHAASKQTVKEKVGVEAGVTSELSLSADAAPAAPEAADGDKAAPPDEKEDGPAKKKGKRRLKQGSDEESEESSARPPPPPPPPPPAP